MGYCLWCRQFYSPKVSWRTLFTVPVEEGFCQVCYRQFAAIDHADICSSCGRDLNYLDKKYVTAGVCSDCTRWEMGEWQGMLQRNRSLYTYNDFLKEVITAYKFRGDALLAQGFKKAFRKCFEDHFQGAIIIPIPLSEERLIERSFNQSELLADLLEKPLYRALIRAVHEEKQSKKGRKERTMPRNNPFLADHNIKERLEGQSVLLIDDIYTTGATLRLAARALGPLHPKSVSSLTLARG